MSFDRHQRTFLDRENERLREGWIEPSAAADIVSFSPSSGDVSLLVARFLEVMYEINKAVDLIPLTENRFPDEAQIAKIDELLRIHLPKWFTQQFEVDKQPPGLGFELEGLSGKEIERRLKRLEKAGGVAKDTLAMFMSDFALTERCWFYAGHRVEDNRLDIAIEQSEFPCRMYSLTELVGYCGGMPSERFKKRGLFGRFLGDRGK
ncbi:hypothetical protein [Yoonia sp. 2307UL14-13]|uniref:hypothetical protein n=1 Tax=Yoonia sp. 2307UL14-13 TaxID=3126506 RepID=UPI0030A68457